jgi:hypothetical protein
MQQEMCETQEKTEIISHRVGDLEKKMGQWECLVEDRLKQNMELWKKAVDDQLMKKMEILGKRMEDQFAQRTKIGGEGGSEALVPNLEALTSVMQNHIAQQFEQWEQIVKGKMGAVFLSKDEWEQCRGMDTPTVARLKGELLHLQRELAERHLQVDHRIIEIKDKYLQMAVGDESVRELIKLEERIEKSLKNVTHRIEMLELRDNKGQIRDLATQMEQWVVSLKEIQLAQRRHAEVVTTLEQQLKIEATGHGENKVDIEIIRTEMDNLKQSLVVLERSIGHMGRELGQGYVGLQGK